MKKLLIVLLAVALLAVVALGQITFDPTYDKSNYLSRFEVVGSDHTDSNYPIADILLEEVETDTSDAYDLHGFNELFSTWRVDEHDADTGRVHCYLQITNMQDNWYTVDSLGHTTATCRTTDSTWALKDWTFPKGAIYCRFIFAAHSAAGDSNGIAYLSHSFMQ